MADYIIQETAGDGVDYTDLDTALASIGANAVLKIQGEWEGIDDNDGVCTVDDDNVTIQTEGDAKHPGYIDTALKHYILGQYGGNHCLQVNNTGCVVDGLVIYQNGTGTSDEGIRMAKDGGTLTVKNCIIYPSARVSDQDGIYSGGISCTVNIENTIIFGFGRAGIHAQLYIGGDNRTITYNINGCSVWNNGQSGEFESGGLCIRSAYYNNDGNINILKSWFVGNYDAGDHVGDLGAMGNDSNISSPYGTMVWKVIDSIIGDDSLTTKLTGTVTTTGSVEQKGITDGTPTVNDIGVEDITTSPYDLRLKTHANNLAQDYADDTNDSVSGMSSLSTDIVGTSRPQNTNYDIGAFEIVVSSGSILLPIMFNHYNKNIGT